MFGIRKLFDRTSRKAGSAGGASRRGRGGIRFEPLEPRAMLAIVLPTAPTFVSGIGNMAGVGLSVSAIGAGPNALTINLVDQAVPGFGQQVVATVSDGTTTKLYFNFNNSIAFSGLPLDPTNAQDNVVSLGTPYGVAMQGDLTGGGSLVWKTTASFTSLPSVTVTLDSADSLGVTTAVAASTIAGKFQSPTLPGLGGAKISLESNSKISVLPTGVFGGVEAWSLALDHATNAPADAIDLQGTIKVTDDVTITDLNSLVIGKAITAGGDITISTAAGGIGGAITLAAPLVADGAIAVTSADDAVTVNATVSATKAGGSVAFTAATLLTVTDDVTSFGPVALAGGTGVVIDPSADVVSTTGGVTVGSVAGSVAAAGTLTATAGAVAVNAKLASTTALVTAATGVTITAGTAATLADATLVTAAGSVTVTAGTDVDVLAPVTVTGNGGISITANNDVELDDALTTLGTGAIAVKATSGTVTVTTLSPLLASDGTIDIQSQGDLEIQPAAPIVAVTDAITLTSAAGRVVIGSLVQAAAATATVTVGADTGLVVSNLVDAAAAIQAGAAVTLATNANQALIDAPVTSNAGAIAIASTLGDVDVRDDLSAVTGITINGNTGAVVAAAAGTITLTSLLGPIAVTSGAALTVGPDVALVLPGPTAGLALTAGTKADLLIPVVAGGDITIASPDGFSVQQALTSTLGKISISATNGTVSSVLAALAANGDIDLAGAASVSVDNALSSTLGGVKLVSSNGSVVVSPTTTIAVPSVTAGSITIDAATALTLGIDLVAGYDVSVTTGTTFTPTTDFTATSGGVSLVVTGGNLNVSASTIKATGGAAAPEGSVFLSAAAGQVTMGPAGSVMTNPVIGDLTIISGLAFTPPLGPLTVGGNLTIESGGSFVPVAGADLESLNGSISLSFENTVDVSLIDVEAKNGNIALTSKTKDVTVGTKSFLVDTVTGTIDLKAPMGLVKVGQPLVAGSDVTVDSFLGFTAPAITSVNGTISLTSAGAGISLVAPLTAGADITAVGGLGDVVVGGALTAPAGTVTLDAFGEVRGTKGSLDPVAAVIIANELVARAEDGSGVGAKLQFTNVANDVETVTLELLNSGGAVGTGVTYVDFDLFTVNSVISSTGTVSLTSINGGINVFGGIGNAPPQTLTGVTLAAVDSIAITGDVVAVAGPVKATSTAGSISINGSATAGTGLTDSLTLDAGNAITITGSAFAGDDVTLKAKTGATLGVAGGTPNTINSVNGDVIVDVTGGPGTIDVNAVVINAKNGGISITSIGSVTFDSGELNAALTWSGGTKGLVSIVGPFGTSTATPPVVRAGRLQITNLTSTPSIFSGANEVSSLSVTTPGDLTFNNTVPLQITDFTSAVPSVQVSGNNVTITSPTGLRVVDGIVAAGTLALTATAAPLGVEFVVTATGDNLPGTFAGTLRDRIEDVNQNAQTKMTLVFDEALAPVSTIGTVTLANALPAVVKTFTLDGSLPVAPAGVGGIVGIDGGAIGVPGTSGLTLGAGSSGSVLQDAAVHGFTGAGVEVLSAGNVLRGLSLGVDRFGNADGNQIGVLVTGKAAARNVIGIAAVGDLGNTIAANTGHGIQITAGANSTTIYGNTIGVTTLGAAAGNGGSGIAVESSTGTRIGSALPGFENLVANNAKHGVFVSDSFGSLTSYGTWIQGNEIRDNGLAGVRIRGGLNNLVGGTGLDEGNLIEGNRNGVELISSLRGPTSGNTVTGNRIVDSTPAPGTTSVGGSGIYVDAGFANLISGNTLVDNVTNGIHIVNAVASAAQRANRVLSNSVTDSGSTPTTGGIVLEASSGQTIGMAGSGNTVFANDGSGIVVRAGLGAGTFKLNQVVGNTVSTNEFDGIRIEGAVANLVRANTVSDQVSGAGIAVVDALAVTGQANRVVGNTAANNRVGIRVSGGSNNEVGGTLPAQGNRIYGNIEHGIAVESGPGTGRASGVLVRNNVIGLDAGNAAAGNGGYGIRIVATAPSQFAGFGAKVDYGNVVNHNASGGVYVRQADNVTIGATVATLGNTIESNRADGILIEEPASATLRTTNVVIAGNTIEANDDWGIRVEGARTSGVRIGRRPSVSQPDQSGNSIRDNVAGGIRVNGALAVTMIGNRIVNNLGSKQVEIVSNDPPPPVLTSVTPVSQGQRSPNYDVRGQISGIAGQRYYVDVYGTRNLTNDQFYLGRALVTIGQTGVGEFRVIVNGRRTTLNGSPGGSAEIVATSTLARTMFESTSEFSNSLST